MTTLLQTGLANAVCAALLAIAALVAARRSRRPALVHSLWLLALLKLVTPPLFPVALPWLPAEGAAVPPPAATLPAQADAGPTLVVLNRADAPFAPAPAVPARDAAAAAGVSSTEGVPAADLAVPAAVPAETPAWPWLLGGVWLTGAAIVLLRAAWHIVRFQRLLRHANPAPEALQERARTLAARLGLRRTPAVLLLPGAVPPLVWAALGRVRIFLPAELLPRLGDAQRDALLAHELAHVARRDHWVRWLELVSIALYWWYPLAWWVSRQLQAHEEECCDAWVVAVLSPRAYALAIVETVDFLAEARAAVPVLASGLGRTAALKRRLTLILTGGAPRRLGVAGVLAVLALAGVLLPLVPVLARSTATPEEPAAEVEPPATPEALASQAATAFLSVPLTFQLRLQAEPDERPVSYKVALAGDGRKLLTESRGDLQVWDAFLGLKLNHFAVGGVDCLALAPDGRRALSAGKDHVLRLWELSSGKQLAAFSGHASFIETVAFSFDGRLALSGDAAGSVLVWDVVRGRQLRRLPGHVGGVRGAAFAPDGRRIYSGGGDRQVRLWDLKTGRELRRFGGLLDEPQGLAVSPDGRRLAALDNDHVYLWDAEAGRPLATLAAHKLALSGLAFSGDGNYLAAAASDGLVRWLDVKPAPVKARLLGQAELTFRVEAAPGSFRLAKPARR
jgi:beta-lactamase regulating signal transducer with metallopeptidase domain